MLLLLYLRILCKIWHHKDYHYVFFWVFYVFRSYMSRFFFFFLYMMWGRSFTSPYLKNIYLLSFRQIEIHSFRINSCLKAIIMSSAYNVLLNYHLYLGLWLSIIQCVAPIPTLFLFFLKHLFLFFTSKLTKINRNNFFFSELSYTLL